MLDDIDIIICILPKIQPKAPTVGPNLLKSHLKQAGFSCFVHDLNIELYKSMCERGQDHHFGADDAIFSGVPKHVTPEFRELMASHASLIKSWIKKWQSMRPRYIGMSIFSHLSQQIAMYLSEVIRQAMPSTKIIWGGAFANLDDGWTNKHKEAGLLDHFIFGDAEQSLVALLQGDQHAKGVNRKEPNQFDMSKMLVPDYSDIDWEQYGTKNIWITASRGCVKRCNFCNVHDQWPEFRFRSGKDVANEIIALRQTYKNRIRHFFFTDSLINGSMKAFRDMMHHLIEYRKTDSDWTWISQYIVRSKSQSPESDFNMMAASGCQSLDIGIESFSENIRSQLGKNFTNADMWWTLEQLNKHGIGASLMGFVGYPTETEVDHQINLDTLREIHRLGYLSPKLRDARFRPAFGGTLLLTQESPLYKQMGHELTYHHNPVDWKYMENDFPTRARRLKEFHDLCDELVGDTYVTDIIARNKSNYTKKRQGMALPEGTSF